MLMIEERTERMEALVEAVIATKQDDILVRRLKQLGDLAS